MTNPTTTAVARRPRYPLLYALAGGGVAGVLIGFALTATAAVPGIVSPNTAVAVGLPLSRAVLDLAALVTVGMSFLPRFVAGHRRVEHVLAPARRIAVVSAAVWFVSALVSLVLEVADTNVGEPVTMAAVREYVDTIASGQALVIVACCALLYVVIGVLAVRKGEEVPAELRITVAMFTLLPLPVTGHAANGAVGWHDISLISMELHVLGAVSWTGGLLAVLLLVAADRTLLADALPRFSALATICVFVTAATGLFNGWYELYSTPDIRWYTALFTTGYGWILIGKLVCVTAAGLLGGYTRFVLLPKIMRRQATAVLTWATVEVAVLGTAFGLAAVLVRAPVVTG
ncbi:MAG TPA: CopD family protein [Pseudonocardiaceae bacterium]|jgi:putative copper resistance protein D|nr:CopD family protein [Pseudonocardiaceae bacterium]